MRSRSRQVYCAASHTSSLYHYGGLIHTEFARFEKARAMFVQVEKLPTKSTIPERTRIEIMNCQTEASLALRDFIPIRVFNGHSPRGKAGYGTHALRTTNTRGYWES